MPFRSILGQPVPVRQLQSAIQNGRLSHCYLFSGPSASGKTTTAAALAATLLCRQPQTDPPDACGVCDACMQVAHHTHPDVVTLHPDGNSIRIQQIRGLRQRLSRSAYSGGYSIVCIHDAERMTTESANALLKILEEPLGPLVFVLLTNHPDSLPVTVRSRCQLLRFQALKQSDLDRLLEESEEDHIRRACALRYCELHACDPRDLLAESGDDALLNRLVVTRQAFFDFISHLADRDPGQILLYLKPFNRDKDILPFLLHLFRSYFTDLLARSVYADAPLHQPDQEPYYNRYTAPPEACLHILAGCDTAQQRLDANVDPVLTLSLCLMHAAATLRRPENGLI